jgi:pimeloyl-ACP methyl ester carboxylesterase
MATSVTLQVTPSRALAPTEICIRACGFAPGQRVRLSSRLVDDLQVTWTAYGEFVAGHDGEVDVHTAPSEGGTFLGLDPAGLFWSLRPSTGDDRVFMTQAVERAHKLGQPACDPLQPLRIEITAEADGLPPAYARVTLDRLDDGVEAFVVRDGRLRGMAFRWRDRSRSRGGIMSLTGSGGGIEMGYAPILASLGYDVLSLAYFAYEDLPETLSSIPLEYFAEGFAWMRETFGSTKLAVQGASRGGELTLVLAAYLPEYVNGALAIVPMYAASGGWDHRTNASGPSWTFGGRDIPYMVESNPISMEEMRALAEQAPNGFAAAPSYYADLARPEIRETCAIPVERANGPILLLSGVDDQMWPCAWGSDLVVNRLRAHGYKHPYRHVALRETGHLTPLPNTVTTFAPALFHSLANVFLACGGTPEGAARQSRITWDEIQNHYRNLFGH